MTVAVAFLFTRIVKSPARLTQAIETELAVRHAMTELYALNDYELRDIGITRSEIESRVRGPAVRAATNKGSQVADDEGASIGLSTVVTHRRSNDTPTRHLPLRATA